MDGGCVVMAARLCEGSVRFGEVRWDFALSFAYSVFAFRFFIS